jgi:hypothetical protein
MLTTTAGSDLYLRKWSVVVTFKQRYRARAQRWWAVCSRRAGKHGAERPTSKVATDHLCLRMPTPGIHIDYMWAEGRHFFLKLIEHQPKQ